MLCVVGDRGRLGDQQHGHARLDSVGAPEPWVVEEFVAHQEQGATILWTHQEAAESLVDHGSAERDVDAATAVGVRRSTTVATDADGRRVQHGATTGLPRRLPHLEGQG